MTKKALLVVSFGISNNDTRERTITATENALSSTFSNHDMKNAYTSYQVRRILFAPNGLLVDSVDKALRSMGHGTSHSAITLYRQLEETSFQESENPNVFNATVEGIPALKDVLPLLQVKTLKDKDSWKSIHTSEGFDVQAGLTGLGKIEGIHRLFNTLAMQATPFDLNMKGLFS